MQSERITRGQPCSFCGSTLDIEPWREEDARGFACVDEDACHARFDALNADPKPGPIQPSFPGSFHVVESSIPGELTVAEWRRARANERSVPGHAVAVAIANATLRAHDLQVERVRESLLRHGR